MQLLPAASAVRPQCMTDALNQANAADPALPVRQRCPLEGAAEGGTGVVNVPNFEVG
jgi:hypothetical protein